MRSAAVLASAAVLLAMAGCADNGQVAVDMSFGQIDSLPALFAATDIVAIGTLASGPTFTATDPRADEYPGDPDQKIPLVTKYAVFETTFDKVIQARPDMAQVPVGSTMKLAFNVINPDMESDEVANSDELRESGFPVKSDLPAVGTQIVIFGTPVMVGSLGEGYEAIAYAEQNEVAQTVTMRFAPGALKGTEFATDELASADAEKEFDKARPTGD